LTFFLSIIFFIIDSISADGSWTFKTLTYPKVNDVAPIEIFFSVVATVSTAKIEVIMNYKNQLGVVNQGFVYDSTKKYICKIKKLADTTDVPCFLTCTTSSSSFFCTALAYSQITAVMF